MSDSDGNFIPYVDDDMGEGIKDFYEEPYGKLPDNRPFRAFPPKEQDDDVQTNFDLEENIGERLNRLETDIRSIKQAIGNHVLINGAWIDITRKSDSGSV